MVVVRSKVYILICNRLPQKQEQEGSSYWILHFEPQSHAITIIIMWLNTHFYGLHVLQTSYLNMCIWGLIQFLFPWTDASNDNHTLSRAITATEIMMLVHHTWAVSVGSGYYWCSTIYKYSLWGVCYADNASLRIHIRIYLFTHKHSLVSSALYTKSKKGSGQMCTGPMSPGMHYIMQ